MREEEETETQKRSKDKDNASGEKKKKKKKKKEKRSSRADVNESGKEPSDYNRQSTTESVLFMGNSQTFNLEIPVKQEEP